VIARRLEKFDFGIFLTMMIILGVGLLALYSATYDTSSHYIKRQLQFSAIGFTFFIVVINIRYRLIRNSAFWIYAAGILSLVAVLLIGKTVKGSTRWIPLGPFSLQVSEFMKLAYIMAMARYLMYRKRIHSFRQLVIPILLTALPMLLILKQPDLGTSLVFVVIFFALIFAAGTKIRQLGGVILAGVVILCAAWASGDVLIKDYQKARIKAFVLRENTQQYSQRSGYQRIQSEIAVGCGGFAGKGWKKGEHLYFLPEQHTDFIFSVIAEEWGFLGVVGTIVCYWVLIALGIGNAMATREPFGHLVIIGVMTWIGFQVIVNTGMTMGLMPITGLTLPLISYGGSSLLSSFLAIALVINVRMHHQQVVTSADYRHA